MTKDTIISQSFGAIITPIAFLGLYPPDNSLMFKIRSYIFYIVLLILTAILAVANLIFEKNLDLVEFNDMCIYCVVTICCTMKLLPFIVQGQRVKKCIHFFGHPRFAARNKQEEEIIDSCIQLCQRICKIYLYGVVMAMVLWLVPVFFSEELKFPIKVWLPYNPRSSPGALYATFVFLLIANAYDSFTSTLTDPLIGSLSYHATTQLKILKLNLQNLDKFAKNPAKDDDSVISFDNVCDILKRCIEHHNDILYFVAEFEHCFSWSIFFQFAGSIFTLCLCFVGFTLMSSTTVDTIKYLSFYVVVLAQEFFYCYFGTLLVEENNGFMSAICNGPWYKYDPKVRKCLITMMERSKKPLLMAAGKVLVLTLQTFTSIAKTSYSLFALLQNIQ